MIIRVVTRVPKVTITCVAFEPITDLISLAMPVQKAKAILRALHSVCNVMIDSACLPYAGFI